MNRYLLNIGYIGTQFRGIQKQTTSIKGQEPKLDNTTIQGCLELALSKFRPINPIKVIISSRTDAGVHALHSTVHVDLENYGGKLYPPSRITIILNKEFLRQQLPIRVISTHHVPDSFHCRYNAKGRTYLYRLAVAKDSVKDTNILKKQGYLSYIPIEEEQRCYFLQGEIDIEKLKEAAKLFVGRHDFRTFMGIFKHNSREARPMFSVRTISELKVSAGAPVTCYFDFDKANQLYNYWDITISAPSFLYKQVRRIVGTLIAAGYGRITTRDIYEMLTIPSKNSWNPAIMVMPPFGLYLCKIHYNEDDLKFPEEIESKQL